MKPLVCIFAHPDDEAFGPSGSIAKFAKERDVYIICVTDGDAGQNSSSQTEELGKIRRNELLKSAGILGVKEVFFLGYKDGGLCNNLYHELASKIEQKLKELDPDTLMTFDLTGISGHIDHITVALVTTFVFRNSATVSTLLYYGEKAAVLDEYHDYFIYMPPGLKDTEIDMEIDINEYWDTKIMAMKTHVSQKHDCEMIESVIGKFPKIEYFKVLKK